MTSAEELLSEAVRLARENVHRGGRPFGAVVTRGGEIVATGVNHTVATNDSTAHAELVAIRAASEALGTPDLHECTIYASGHPCPMCLGAMYMSGIGKAFYAYSNDEGEPYGLSSAATYAEFAASEGERSITMTHLPVRPDGEPDLYELWRKLTGP